MALADVATGGLKELLTSHPLAPTAPLVHWRRASWTVAQIQDGAERFAALLDRHGASDGAPIAALVTSGPAAVAQMFGAWMVGCPYIPINARLSDAEVVDLLADSPPAVLVHERDRPDVDGPWAAVRTTGELAWELDGVAPGRPRPYGHDVAIVMRTSGTTGRPKPVIHTHRSMLTSLDTVIGAIRQRSDETSAPSANLIPVTLSLSAGIYNTLFAFRVGAAVVLLDRFSTSEVQWAVREFSIRSSVLAPAMITMLSDDQEIDSLQPLRIVRSITAPLRPSEARRFFERFGVAVLNSYGQTELGGEVVGWTANDWRTHRTTKLGSVGRVHPGVDLKIKDAAGKELGHGQTGDIFVRSPFFVNEELLKDRIDDGFVRTGDVGHLDEDGFLWIDGRESDMINRGGLKVMPDEVEEVLRAHPAVRDVCVAGIPDHRLGEVPFAWVVVDDQALDDEALTAWCRDRLSAYKVPVGFAAIAEIPRSEIGKVLRRQLVETLSAAT